MEAQSLDWRIADKVFFFLRTLQINSWKWIASQPCDPLLRTIHRVATPIHLSRNLGDRCNNCGFSILHRWNISFTRYFLKNANPCFFHGSCTRVFFCRLWRMHNPENSIRVDFFLLSIFLVILLQSYTDAWNRKKEGQIYAMSFSWSC